MFAYLSKKIGVGASAETYACAWDAYDGYLAIGASDGFLKLVKLENKKTKG